MKLKNITPYKPIAGDKTGKTRWTFFCKYLGGELYNSRNRQNAGCWNWRRI